MTTHRLDESVISRNQAYGNGNVADGVNPQHGHLGLADDGTPRVAPQLEGFGVRRNPICGVQLSKIVVQTCPRSLVELPDCSLIRGIAAF